VREKSWLEQARSREGDREASGSVEWPFHKSVGQTTKLQHTRIGVFANLAAIVRLASDVAAGI
jgi:hypothetical protein